MRVFILLFITQLILSCETSYPVHEANDKFYGNSIEIHTIDSCEYIYIPSGNASWGSHKGNCKFCKERNK